MDVTEYLQVCPAPQILFERAARRAAQPRYMLPTSEGGWQPLTWSEHAAGVREVACGLMSRGLHRGERVAVFGGNSPRWMEAALGVQAAGAVMVPVYPASTSEQAAYVIDHSDAKVVFVAGEELLGRILQSWEALEGLASIVLIDAVDPQAVLEEMRDAGDPTPPLGWVEKRLLDWDALRDEGREADAAHPQRFEARMQAIEPNDNAVMLYTSGTTGAPKGVPLSHRNIGINARDWLECNGPQLPEDGVDVLWLPMSHIFGFGEACLGNNLGFTSYLCSPKDVLKVVPIVRPTVFMSVPAYWEKLAASSIEEPDAEAAARSLAAATGGRLQFCLSGGAGLSGVVKTHFKRCGVLILEGYGLTECSPTLTLNRPDDYRFDSVGKALPNVELRLADDGEILARGPSVFEGYHKDPQSTRAAFTDEGWFKTGDVGRWTEDGFLQIIDRKKEILVTAGGKNVPPANIESMFASDPVFDHVVVYGDGRKYLVAGVWLNDAQLEARARAGSADPADPKVREQVVQSAVDAANARLARFEQIKRFRIMDRPLTVEGGLLTSTLKIRRKRIYAAFEGAFEGLYA